jgi:heme/copper-type cytochrome/quinol oxidase subunit 2
VGINFQREVGWALLAGGALLLGSCAAPSTLAPQGPAAERIAGLWWIMLGLAGAIYALVLALLLIGLFRRRRLERERHTTDGRAWILGGGVALPVAVLILLFALTICLRLGCHRPR